MLLVNKRLGFQSTQWFILKGRKRSVNGFVSLIMYYILLAFRIITFQFLCAKICDVIFIYSFGKVRRIIVAIFEITNSKTNGLVLIRASENEMMFSL